MEQDARTASPVVATQLGKSPVQGALVRQIASFGALMAVGFVTTIFYGALGASYSGAAALRGVAAPTDLLSSGQDHTWDLAQAGGDKSMPVPALQLATLESPMKGPIAMSFYMYTVGTDNAVLENVKELGSLGNTNAADLPGIMWHLHNEVVIETPRKGRVDRIKRFRVTMRNTEKLFRETHRHFGPYAHFRSGACQDRHCEAVWSKYGFNVGCRFVDASAYVSPFVTRPAGGACPPHCNTAVQYSLPGPCPAFPNENKTASCSLQQPGGECSLFTKDNSCTYQVKAAGSVELDSLTGIQNYTQFWAVNHKREYDPVKDRGDDPNHFWDKKLDVEACRARMDRVQELFKEKYPHLPVTLGEPPCDAVESGGSEAPLSKDDASSS